MKDVHVEVVRNTKIAMVEINKVRFFRLFSSMTGRYIGTTKTKSEERQIVIGPTLMKALVNFKNRQMELRLLYGKDYYFYHKDIETTENYYISSTDENKKNVNNVFDNLMSSETINKI